MEQLLKCDNCQEEFNQSSKQPKILPKCGHTLCLQCIKSLKNSQCTQCGTKQNIENPDSLLLNEKLMNILEIARINSAQNQSRALGQSQKTQNLTEYYEQEEPLNVDDDFQTRVSTIQSPGKVYCNKHADKEIEYFCKICHSIVCSKCMFAEHNGHELAQLEDVTSIIKQNIYDLHKLLLNTKRINDDNRNYMLHIKEEVQRLKDQQLRNIDKGFSDLIKKLEEKREELKNEFSSKYLVEENKILGKTQILDQNSEEVQNIEIIYDELMKFIQKNGDAKILTKINDISSFISKSIEDLEKIAKNKGLEKNETLIDPSLKPLTLNVQKAYEIISKFNMVPTAKQPKTQEKIKIPIVNQGYQSSSSYGSLNDRGAGNTATTNYQNTADQNVKLGTPNPFLKNPKKQYQDDIDNQSFEHNAQNIQQQLTQLRTNFLKEQGNNNSQQQKAFNRNYEE